LILGKYGKMILNNMERNYPYRKQELELTGELNLKIFEREQYIIKLKEQVEEQIIKENPQPKTNEISVIAKYQQMIEELVDEILKEGTERARKTAKETMKKVKCAMKLDYFDEI